MSGIEFRGAIIARNSQQAQIGLDRMAGVLGVSILSARSFVRLSPHSYQGVRGTRPPNRVLIYELSMAEIPDELWHTLIPALYREAGEPISIYHFGMAREQPLNLGRPLGHPFTVRRQDGLGPHPPELPCAYRHGGSGICGMRADQHVAVPLARGARGAR